MPSAADDSYQVDSFGMGLKAWLLPGKLEEP